MKKDTYFLTLCISFYVFFNINTNKTILDKTGFIFKIIASFSKGLHSITSLNQLTIYIDLWFRKNFKIVALHVYINSEQNDCLVLSSGTIRENKATDFKKIKNRTHEKIIEQAIKTQKTTIFSLNKKENSERRVKIPFILEYKSLSVLDLHT